MIKNKMALLGAVATLGMVGGGFVFPAQAIVYNVSANLAGGGTLSGFFDYTPTTYTDWDFTVSGTTLGLGQFNTTYDINSSFILSSDSTGLQVALNGSDIGTGNYQYIHLSFTDALTVAGQSTTLVQGTNPLTPSIMAADGGGGFASIVINNSGSSVVAVPWETDALSVIGATTLFGFGVWTKRKRKVDLSK
jgi:hypothetical protein